LKYFELAFLRLQLVKILCKLIIIYVNCKKNKKGSLFYETPCILRRFTSLQSLIHWLWPDRESNPQPPNTLLLHSQVT